MHGNANGNTTSGSPNVNGSPNGSTPTAAGPAKVTSVSAGSFPEIAWRGPFADYRNAMIGTSECSDTVHFVTFWAAMAARLGRKISMWSGSVVYPNVYLSFFDESNDKKTTGQRRLYECSLCPGVPIISGAGSTEGLCDQLSTSATDGRYILNWEEFATFLAVARFARSTLLEFLVETFDCPNVWERKYRKNPITINDPTPTVLAMTTPSWFWLHAKPEDFYGGFGNRFLYLCGAKKAPISQPGPVNGENIHKIQEHLAQLESFPIQGRARWTTESGKAWDDFYYRFEAQPRKGLLGVALKRIHIYVRKLAMTYAWIEGNYPDIHLDQLNASIAVGLHAAKCTRLLFDLQTTGDPHRRELEERILGWIQKHDGEQLRTMQRRLCRHAGDAETFNRVVRSLVLADVIEIRPNGRRKTVHLTR
jgi:hypothetical protein